MIALDFLAHKDFLQRYGCDFRFLNYKNMFQS